jgi:hypothetical protein
MLNKIYCLEELKEYSALVNRLIFLSVVKYSEKELLYKAVDSVIGKRVSLCYLNAYKNNIKEDMVSNFFNYQGVMQINYLPSFITDLFFSAESIPKHVVLLKDPCDEYYETESEGSIYHAYDASLYRLACINYHELLVYFIANQTEEYSIYRYKPELPQYVYELSNLIMLANLAGDEGRKKQAMKEIAEHSFMPGVRGNSWSHDSFFYNAAGEYESSVGTERIEKELLSKYNEYMEG